MSPADLLDSRIRACIRKRGFSDLSEVQTQAIPRVLSGEHMVLIAPTGTGKTESAMLPVFNSMLSLPGGGFQGPVHYPAQIAEPGHAPASRVVV